MKTVVLVFLLAGALLLTCSYDSFEASSPNTVFVSCTSCPNDIRGFLTVPAGTPCDMVNWNLQVSDNGNYTLTAKWGYYVDNATFKYTGELKDSKGSWTINKQNPGFKESEIYTLTANKQSLQLLKLNDNMFHLMGHDKKILTGTEGYANVLNRADPVTDKDIDFSLVDESGEGRNFVLAGRTPSKQISKELNFDVDRDKVKWLIKFFTDGRFEMNRTLERPTVVKGKWTITKGWDADKDATVYKLDAESPNPHTIYLLKASPEVFLILSKQTGLMVGDKEFSYALIRRPPSGQ